MNNFLPRNSALIGLFCACMLMFSVSCAKLLPPDSTTTTPDPLEVHGGKVDYSISVVLPPKALRKGYTYTAQNFYVYGDQEKKGGALTLNSVDYPESKKQQSKKSTNLSLDYDPAMNQGELQIQFSMTKVSNGKTKLSEERLKVASGLITTSSLIQPTYDAAYADHEYNDQEELIPNEVSFYFAQSSSKLSQVELRQERVKTFDAFIADKNVTRSVIVTGMHSPEGQERTNSQLASDRADVIEEWYRRRMKKYDYKNMADSISFRKNPIVEDWTAFRTLLREYEGISDEQKNRMLDVVNGGGSFIDKEEELQSLPGYQKVFKSLYPSLRVANTSAMTIKKKRPNAEVIAYAKQIGEGSMPADSLTHEELLYGAANNPILDEKISIYRASVQQKGSWMAYNNLGAALLHKAATEQDGNVRNQLIEEATAQLELANKTGAQNAETAINLAVVYLLQGNSERAYTTLTEVTSQNPSPNASQRLNAIKGALEAQQGDYEKALSTLNSAVSSKEVHYNKGIVHLLQRNYSEADATFQKLKEMFMKEGEEQYAKDPTHARLHYLMAVSLARQGVREGMLDHLQKASSGDVSLKERAISDLEFRDYADIVRQI